MIRLSLLVALVLLPAPLFSQFDPNAPPPAQPLPLGAVPLAFTGGHELGENDYGRPVVLIAAALKVKPDVFRQAFSGVTPAPGGEEPDPRQVGKNKEALLSILAPYGVTNERLDTVANFYRFHPERGELWRHQEAEAYARVDQGKVTSIVIVNPGYGYNSVPQVSLPGWDNVQLTAVLKFSTDLEKNGAVAEIKMEP